MMSDGRENKIKKLKMRSMRRGIKEMDVILSYYSEVCLEKMPELSWIYILIFCLKTTRICIAGAQGKRSRKKSMQRLSPRYEMF